MADLQTSADTWKNLADEGVKLKDQFGKLPKNTPLGDDERKKIDALAALAALGTTQLRAAADAHRRARLAALSADIAALDTALSTNLSPAAEDQVRARQNALLAERAQLELVAAGDFSHVVQPEFVNSLLGNLNAAREEAAAKQRVATVLPLLVNAVQLAVKIASAIVAIA